MDTHIKYCTADVKQCCTRTPAVYIPHLNPEDMQKNLRIGGLCFAYKQIGRCSREKKRRKESAMNYWIRQADTYQMD